MNKNNLKRIIREELKALIFQKNNLLKKIKENSRVISDKITDETLSDLHLYACILDLERLSNEYAFIQGKISSHETFLFQWDDEQRGEWE